MNNKYSYIIGLENMIHQCWRITPNWKCHLKCNFCYVPQLLHKRKEKYGRMPESTLDLRDYRNVLRKMLEAHRRRSDRIPMIPLSFCAADPPRDKDLQIELMLISREEVMSVYEISKEAAEKQLATTIILDVHDKGAMERCLEMMDGIAKVWKHGFVWIASTLWIVDRELEDDEIERHFEAHKEAGDRGFAFFSIITPTATKQATELNHADYIEVAKKVFEVVCHSKQYMATINVAVPVIEGWRGYSFEFLKNSLGKTFTDFYYAYCAVNTLAFCNKFNISPPSSLVELVGASDIEFESNTHYVVCEYGIIPGLGKIFSIGTDQKAFYSNGFGCFPTIGCFTGIMGIEPSGYVSACQFGHDEVDIRAGDVEDFDMQVVYSPQRLRNIREKIAYPFFDNYCEYRECNCNETSCSEFSRGSCPVDLYFQDRDYLQPSYTCALLSRATDHQIDLIQSIGLNPVEYSIRAVESAEKEFNSIVAPQLMEKRLLL